MIWHQAPRQDFDAGSPASLDEQVDVQRIIGGAEKRLLAPVATLRDVVGCSWDDDAGDTRHKVVDSTGRSVGQEQKTNNSGTFGEIGTVPNFDGTSSTTIFNQPPPAGHAKKMSEVLGEIVWLMSQSPLHKQFFIQDLEWFVMTPVLLQQFRLFYDKDKPIGLVLWATVSEEVEALLARGTTKLRPQDWKSGDRLWVVEVIAPFGGSEEMVKDLKANVHPGRELKFLELGRDGTRAVRFL